jgi:hypothetical protein
MFNDVGKIAGMVTMLVAKHSDTRREMMPKYKLIPVNIQKSTVHDRETSCFDYIRFNWFFFDPSRIDSSNDQIFQEDLTKERRF